VRLLCNNGGRDAGSRGLHAGSRSLEQKRGLVKDITAAVVKNAAVTPETVSVSLVEMPKHSKGKGGVLFSEKPPR
jgi:4-oxalocrotonate tautomerase